jgi:glycosyltransferase involved in cell wall biosynthesis
MHQSLEGKSLGIIEEALCGYTAHWFEWIRSVKLVNEAQGVRVRIAGNKGLDPEVARVLSAEAVLERNSWESPRSRPSALKRYTTILSHNYFLYRNCAQLLERWEPIDCIQVPVVRIHHLIAWLALTRRFGGRRFQRLVMQVNMPEGRHEKGRSQPVFKRSSFLIQQVLRAYGPYVAKGLVCLGSDSDQTAKDYEILSGVPFVEFPTPRVSPHSANKVEKRTADTRVVFCCLGPSRHEKGSDLLLAAIQAYLQLPERTPARFVLQWTDDFSDPIGRWVSPAPWLLRHPDVQVLRGSLTSEQYDRHLLASDCLILPYRWDSYFCRISGLAIEAATAGIPAVYTEDTWLERAMKRYGAGVAFRDGDVANLVEKLVEMAKNIDKFHLMAQAQAPIARSVHSPENFLDCLWGNGSN